MSIQNRPALIVEQWDIRDVKPCEQNPRDNDGAVESVARSFQEFGFRQPIVVDEAGVIIVGHTRYKAALKLGMDIVPVHLAAGMSPAQVKAYGLADNKTADSTLIGAQQTGRRAFLMELDPLCCDVIVQRYDQFTGEKIEWIAAPELTA